MLKYAAAAAFACTIVLASNPSDARARFRMFSSGPKSVVTAPRAMAAAPRGNVGLFIPVGSRPAAAAPAPQQAINDQAKGPLLFDPTLATAEKPAAADGGSAPKDAPSKEMALAPSAECAITPLKDAKREGKEVVANEPVKTALTQSRSALLTPAASRQSRVPAQRTVSVCYMQRDGTCVP